MTQMLLLNPAKRRRSGGKKRRASTSRRRRRNPIATPAARQTRRVARRTTRRMARRANPSARRIVRRRRRNPIALGGSARSMIAMFKEALIGGVGAVAVDVLWGQVNGFLPASMQRVPGQPGVGDAVKAVGTALLGKLLSRPTRGMSVKAAQASLIVQAHGIVASFIPGSMPLGYSIPGQVVNARTRIGPNTPTLPGMGRYTALPAPVLSRYTSAPTPFLGGSRQARMSREGFAIR